MKTLIKNCCSYNADTGEIICKIKPYRNEREVISVGYVHGIQPHKYRRFKFKHKRFLAHRIAWFLYYNEWPHQIIDHIDGNGLNNRINNLRLAEHWQNAGNRHYHRSGKLVGATFDKRKNRWIAQIVIDGKYSYLGAFHTEKEAHERYLEARKEIQG